MAIILKSGKTYPNPYRVEPMTSVYAVINQANLNKKHGVFHGDLEFYESKEASKDPSVRPFKTEPIDLSGELFQQVLTIEALSQADCNQFSLIYNYILGQKVNPGLNEDGSMPDESECPLKYGDFESDE